MKAEDNSCPSPDPYKIPATYRIGVTGHRDLSDENLMRTRVKEALNDLGKLFKNTPGKYVLVSPLAEGADRLLVNEVLAWDICESEIHVVLPLPQDDYITDFKTESSKEEFLSLLGVAKTVKTLESSGSRTEAYENVGKYIVDSSDLLISIWDGKEARGQGGTGEIVKYARGKGLPVIWIHSDNGKITKERLDSDLFKSFSFLDIYNGEKLNKQKVREGVESTVKYFEEKARESALSTEVLNPAKAAIIPHFIRSDILAISYQKRHVQASNFINMLAVLAIIAVTVYLVFAHNQILLWLEASFMVFILLILAVASYSDWHRKWIDYRFLAERLRTSIFFSIAGIEYKLMESSQYKGISKNTDWVINAFEWIWSRSSNKEINTGDEIPFENMKGFLKNIWIEDQAKYFKKKSHEHHKKHKQLDIIVIFLFSATFFAAISHPLGIFHAIHFPLISLEKVMDFVVIVFPALGAALRAIAIQREHQRNAQQYQGMAQYLHSIAREIDKSEDIEVLKKHLENANEVILGENQNWRLLLLLRKIEAP